MTRTLPFTLVALLSLLTGCKSAPAKEYGADCKLGADRIKVCDPNIFLSQSQEKFIGRCTKKANQGSTRYQNLAGCLKKSEGDCQRVDTCLYNFKNYKEAVTKGPKGQMGTSPAPMTLTLERWRQQPRKYCQALVDGLYTCLINKNMSAPATPQIPEAQKIKMVDQCVKSLDKKVTKEMMQIATCVYDARKDCDKIMACMQRHSKKRSTQKKERHDRGPKPTNNLPGPLPPPPPPPPQKMDARCIAWAGTLSSCTKTQKSAYKALLQKLCAGPQKLSPRILMFTERCLKRAKGKCDMVRKCAKLAEKLASRERRDKK